MSASSGYPPLFQSSSAFAATTLQMPPSMRPPRTMRDVVGALWRQWRVVGGGIALALAAAALLRAEMPPVYVASATILLQPEPREFVTAGQADASGAVGGDAVDGIGRRMRAEMTLLRSRHNAQMAVARLDLHENQFAESGLAALASAFGSSQEPVDAPVDRERTVDRFLEAVTIEPQGVSAGGQGPDMLQVRLACTDRWIASRALQAFIDSYLRLAARHHRQVAQTSSRVLEARVADARDTLRRSEDAIVGLLVGDEGQLLDTDPPGAGPGAANGAGARSMVLRLDDEPDMVPRASTRAAAGGPRDSLAAIDVASAIARPSGLRLDETAPGTEADPVPARSTKETVRLLDAPPPSIPVHASSPLGAQLARLEQQRGAALERYTDLQRQLERVDDLVAAPGTDPAASLLLRAPARPSTVDSAPPDGLVLPFVLVGMIAGIAYALVRELGGDRLRSARDVRWALGVPVLGALPTLSARSRHALVGPAFTRAQRDALDEE